MPRYISKLSIWHLMLKFSAVCCLLWLRQPCSPQGKQNSFWLAQPNFQLAQNPHKIKNLFYADEKGLKKQYFFFISESSLNHISVVFNHSLYIYIYIYIYVLRKVRIGTILELSCAKWEFSLCCAILEW